MNNIGRKKINSILYPLYSEEMKREKRGKIDGQVVKKCQSTNLEF
jgi:hypothetical protein